jgi:class 3 adenylate cyclase/CHASE2 domain-containing sensor protein
MQAPFVLRQLPTLVAATVTLAVCVLQALRLPSIESLEAQTYDWRVRLARGFPSVGATNLGFVFMSDESIVRLAHPSHPLRCGLYWPRHIYGRALEELSAQGAKAVGFDILLTGLRPDHAPVQVVGTEAAASATQFLAEINPGRPVTQVGASVLMESDDYLAWQLRRAGMGLLAAEVDAQPASLFATNAAAVGDVSADRDRDGVLRRARPFKDYRRWHRLFLQAEIDYGVKLSHARISPSEIVLIPADGQAVRVPLDANGCFNLADFLGDKLPAGWPAKAKPFDDERIWHMGIVLAAAELGLDLAKAQVDERRHELHLPGTNGVSRAIPLDADGAFYIDWSLSTTDPRLLFEAIDSLLDEHLARSSGKVGGQTNPWRGRLVLVGSSATGNDLTDRGSTPLERDTLLVSEHWNIANSLLTGRFVRPAPLAGNLAIIVVVGALTALLTWRLRALTAALAVLALGGVYCAAAAWLYVQWRIWVPIILPVGAAIMVQHVCLVSYRVVFEEREKRRVRSFFAKVVSPDIVQELLRADKLSAFDGSHREVTVMFSDVRGFTDLTDRHREAADQHIRDKQLSAPDATAFLDEQARQTLLMVNLYLATVADCVKQHTGTLDKYIGDCVMAFWGAPTPNPRHALAAVQSAIDAQRAIAGLNRQRAEENQRRAAASPPLPPLPLLSLGSGINTGVAIVGLMGSDDHILNYTVFGREVNLASRLESVSGRGRIVIGETTFQHLERDAPALAARCQQLAPTSVKGIREALVCYEVPWQENGQGPKAGG